MIARLCLRKALLAIAAAAGAGLLLTVLAGAAMAHANLLRSEPEAGSVVERLPTRIYLKFSEPVDAPVDAIRVIGPDGELANEGPARVVPEDSTALEVPVRDRGRGTYTVVWRAISADGHPVSGSFTFGLGVVPASSQSVEAERIGLLLLAVSRWIHLLAMVLALGPLIYGLLVRPRPTDATADLPLLQLAFSGVLMLLVTSVVMLLGQATAVGGSLDAALSAAMVSSVLGSRWGLLWAARLAVSTVLALGVIFAMAPAAEGRGVRPFWWLSLLTLGVLLLVLTSLNGHAAVTEPVGLAVLMDTLHLGSAAAWIGAMAALVVVDLWRGKVSGRPDWLAYMARIFLRLSNLSIVALQLLLITGFYGAWMQVKVPQALMTTDYGRALLAKLSLVALVVLLGAYHFLVVRPRLEGQVLEKSAATGTQFPIRTLQLEFVGTVAILAASALLSSLPPVPTSAVLSTAQSAPKPSLTLAENAGTTMVVLSLTPARAGSNEVLLRLSDPYDKPVTDARVTVEARNLEFPSQGGVTARAQASGNGTYRASLYLAGEGRWSFQVNLDSGGSRESASFSLQLPVSGAVELLATADRAMNRLSTLVGEETLSDGRAVVQSRYEFQAPDRMHLVVEGAERRETFAMGQVRYDRAGSGPWSKEPWPAEGGFRWPDYRFSATAEDVVVLGRESVGDVECFVVAFRDGPSGALYKMWIGVGDYLIRQYRMIMPGHYMTVNFSGFNIPIEISPPTP